MSIVEEVLLERKPTPEKRALYFNRRKFTRRSETWGTVVYDFERDLFFAESKLSAGEAITPEAPLGLYWLVTAPCNLKCIHCYGNVEELPAKSLTTRDQRIIADRIISSGAMRVTLNGGEPLLRKDTPEMIERLADANVSVLLGTNGTFLTPSILSSVKRANRVEISFDSHDETVNNSIRVSRAATGNAHKESLAAIRLACENNVKLRVLTCLNLRNATHVGKIADVLYSMGVRDWSVSWTLHAGRARHIYESLVSPSLISVESEIQEIRAKYSDMTIKYSNRSDAQAGHNRFSCLVFPDGRMFAEDLSLGEKIPFHSLLDAPLLTSWTDENYNRQQHFKRWVGDRISVRP